MESSPAEKQMCSTNCKGNSYVYLDRIFNVRKVPYKPYTIEKCKQFLIKILNLKYLPFKRRLNSQKPVILV
jgi:hypothetical protein